MEPPVLRVFRMDRALHRTFQGLECRGVNINELLVALIVEGIELRKARGAWR